MYAGVCPITSSNYKGGFPERIPECVPERDPESDRERDPEPDLERGPESESECDRASDLEREDEFLLRRLSRGRSDASGPLH